VTYGANSHSPSLACSIVEGSRITSAPDGCREMTDFFFVCRGLVTFRAEVCLVITSAPDGCREMTAAQPLKVLVAAS
jgi:hypothetical protein